ncbi:MAG: hypothetical protein V7749_00900 [Cocleimonas sp.]
MKKKKNKLANKQFSIKRGKRQDSFKTFYRRQLITIATLLSLGVEFFFSALKDAYAPCVVMDEVRCNEIVAFANVEALVAIALFTCVLWVFKGILKHRLTYT